MADNQNPSEIKVRDPLSEVTRKERRFLLGVCVIGITVVKTGLLPTKISALGIEFGTSDQKSLMLVFFLVTIYFLAAFVIYGLTDFFAWRLAIANSLWRIRAERRSAEENAWRVRERQSGFAGVQGETDLHSPVEINERMTISDFFYRATINPVSLVRAIFEFIVPIAFGIYTIIIIHDYKSNIDNIKKDMLPLKTDTIHGSIDTIPENISKDSLEQAQ